MSKTKGFLDPRTEREREAWCEEICNLSPGQRKDCKVQEKCPKDKKEE